MNLQSYLKINKGFVDSRLLQLITDDEIPKRLREAMNYSLMAGGKRLRPILAIAGAEAVGGKCQDVLDLASALEMIHTFSLIHDDLPAMDDDDLRRGKPTNHKVFGEDTAILAGDGLLIEAFYLLASKNDGADKAALVEIIRDIAHAVGGRGMTGGQVLDMDAQNKKITLADLERIHKYKTGALINASVTSGAKFCRAQSEEIERLRRYGSCIGLAFQITDDILDITGDVAAIGKDVGSDLENEKSTYPSVVGLEESKKIASQLIDESLKSLSTFGGEAEPLRMIARYVVERRS